MKAIVYPYGDENPYQRLLYQAVAQEGVSLLRMRPTRLNVMLFPLILMVRRLQGYRVLHLHWLIFNTKVPRFCARQLSLVLTLWSLLSAKLLGYRIVWTVHNVLPHETLTSNDPFVARFLSRIASRLIVHSTHSLQQMEQQGLSTARTAIIPHGNYIGVYPDAVTPLQARKRLGIKPDEQVVLFFGLIRPYKGVEDLITAFNQISSKQNVRLLIAGKCQDKQLTQIITEAAERFRITFHNEYVADADVATYFKAADVVCLPFKAITTSGSALLALSFGKPIIAPRIGALCDFPAAVGYLYDAPKPDALADGLAKALLDDKRAARVAAARRYVQTLSWDKIARQTVEAYKRSIS